MAGFYISLVRHEKCLVMPLWQTGLIAVLLLFTGTSLFANETRNNDMSPMSASSSQAIENDAKPDIDLMSLRTIYLPSSPGILERKAADLLRKKLGAMHGVKLRVVLQDRWMGDPAILLGPDLAVSSGLTTLDDLGAVREEGYLIEGSGTAIALAGNADQGTLYAVHRFLKLAGLHAYPWHYGNGLEVMDPAKGGMIPPVSVNSSPFFDFRDFLYRYQPGRYGGTLREYSVGDFRFIRDSEEFKSRGWLAWNHTAAFLVPLHEFYDEHPEYYGRKHGARIPKSTRNLRLPLCTCEKDVHEISSRRALKWIGVQKERRYFAITNGDVAIQCPQCESADPLPDYTTDRLLRWVNSVARDVAVTYPDKVLLTYAYLQSVKPPVETILEPNVLVMYAPWYWSSRTTSAVSFAHPLNVTAMEEFMGWSMLFPGQVGVYDYPVGWVEGTSEKIKFFAKNDVSWFHANVPQGDLMHWVASQLLWDPLQDKADLDREFLEAYYGPAKTVMGEYLDLRQEVIDKRSMHTQHVFRDSGFLRQARLLMDNAQEIAENSDVEVQTRILEGVQDGIFTVLKNERSIQRDMDVVRRDFERLLSLQMRIIKNGAELGFSKGSLRYQVKLFKSRLSSLGVMIPKGSNNIDIKKQVEDDINAARSRFSDLVKMTGSDKDVYPAVAKKQCTHIEFSSRGEKSRWVTGGSQQELVSNPAVTTIPLGAGKASGIKITAPLSRLTTLDRDARRIHAGRFFAERVFDTPLNTDGCVFLDFHVYASGDVPLTIYVDKLRSDIQLHAGEQYIRIDLRSFYNDRKGAGKFNAGDAVKIKSIAFDIWPQDNFYPYPDARDVELVILDLQASNYLPDTAPLSGEREGLWLSHFRPNIPFKDTIIEISNLAMQHRHSGGVKDRSIAHEYGRRYINARFRSFTSHRIVSPVTRIIIDKDASSGEQQAASMMRGYLEEMYGVNLPVNAVADSANTNTGNAIIIGARPGLDSGRISRLELKHAGKEGFVVSARNGRIVIAGESEAGTLSGVERYLEDHGAKFNGDNSWLPERQSHLLHELYLVDKPYFSGLDRRCGMNGGVPDNDDLYRAKSLARKIKNSVRRGDRDVDIRPSAIEKSTLSCYVMSRLLWDPFMNLGSLVSEYNEYFGGYQSR